MKENSVLEDAIIIIERTLHALYSLAFFNSFLYQLNCEHYFLLKSFWRGMEKQKKLLLNARTSCVLYLYSVGT